LWRYTSELFYSDEVDVEMQKAGVAPNMSEVFGDWKKTVDAVLDEATLQIPTNNWKQEGGRKGMHSEHFGYILTELQYMQRAYPNMEW
jgi:ring-1,2-phenylacetyl-CoA epoxidase subunit PaaC